jgi:hypothetical protein
MSYLFSYYFFKSLLIQQGCIATPHDPLFVADDAVWDELHTKIAECLSVVVKGNADVLLEVLGEAHASLSVILLGDD